MYRTIGALGLVCLVFGPLLAHLRVVPPLVGLIIFSVSGLFGALAVLLGAVGLLRRRGRRPLAGLLLGLVPVACLLVLAILNREHPPINDVTTDLADPPALARAPAYPGAFVPVVRAAYPDLTSLLVDAPPALVFQEAMELAAVREGWTVARAYDHAMSFEGVAETWLFRFRDDFAVRVRARGDQSVVDMRSRSRDGKGDVGTNARRIRAFLDELGARLENPANAAR